MVLHPKQAQIAKSRKRFRVVNCGRRFGKTLLATEEITGFAYAKKDRRIAYIAPTYQQARDIAWAILKRKLQDIALNINESRLEIEIPTQDGGTSWIYLRGWESIETMRGQSFDFLVIDEIAMMRNFFAGWQEVLRPTLTDRVGHALFISTPRGFNHFYDLYNNQDKDDSWQSFHFTTYDNPFIPKDEIEEAKKILTEDRFAQEYLADFRKTEGLVYKGFSRDIHIYSDIPPRAEIVTTLGGHDFGTNNPCASITIKKDQDAVYWVHNEWYETGKTDAQQADYIAALKWDACYPDPASASGILELKRRGVNVRDVIKCADSVRNGINTVKELFKTGRLKINKDCTNLIWELETYSYPDRKPYRNEEENPIKENDHALDALRYALMMDNQLSVKKVRPIIHKAPRQRVNIAI